MMTLGLTVSILVTFLLLPSLLTLFSSTEDIYIQDTEKSKITAILGKFVKNSKLTIFGATAIVLVLSLIE